MTSISVATEELLQKIKNNPLPLYPNGYFTRDDLCNSDCELCNGHGFVRQNLPITDANFGKMEICPNRTVDKSKRAGLTDEEAKYDWTTCRDINNITEAIEAVNKTLNRGWGWVYLHGGYGLGKTLVLKVAVSLSLKAQRSCAFARMVDILDNLKTEYNAPAGSGSPTALLQKWATVKVLAIDELDRMKNTEYAQEKKFSLLDKRYETAMRRDSVTIMASNEPPESLPGWLADRLKTGAFHIVSLSGQSFRPAQSVQLLDEMFGGINE